MEKILGSKIKPNLSNFSKEELINLLSGNSVCLDDKFEDLNKEELEKIIHKQWEEHLIYNDLSEPIECLFCYNYITNSDFMILKCSHYSHSTCFFNYLCTNLQHDNKIDLEIKLNLFRCPNCRSYLTEQIEKKYNDNFQLVESESESDLEENEVQQVITLGHDIGDIEFNLGYDDDLINNFIRTNPVQINNNTSDYPNLIRQHINRIDNLFITNNLFNTQSIMFDNGINFSNSLIFENLNVLNQLYDSDENNNGGNNENNSQTDSTNISDYSNNL